MMDSGLIDSGWVIVETANPWLLWLLNDKAKLEIPTK